MLVIHDRKYKEGVPVQLCTIAIDKALEITTPHELNRTSKTWRQTHLSVALLNSVAASKW